MPCFEAEVYRLSPYSKHKTWVLSTCLTCTIRELFILMTDPCVLRPPDFYEEGYAQVTMHTENMSANCFPGRKQLKISKLLLNVDSQIKEFSSEKKYMYISCIKKTIHLVIKNICIFFFNLRFLNDFNFEDIKMFLEIFWFAKTFVSMFILWLVKIIARWIRALCTVE